MEPGRADDQELALRVRMGGDIYRGSAFHRNRLNRSGLGKSGIHKVKDLLRLPPMTLDDVAYPSTLLLVGGSSRGHKARRYAPLQWIKAGEVPLSYSEEDLYLLGDLGRRLLLGAGLSSSDVIANLVAPGSTREHWQFLLGAQAAGISSIALGGSAAAAADGDASGAGAGTSMASIDVLEPTVLIGETSDVARLLDAASHDDEVLGRLHTVILTGRAPTPRQHKRIMERLGGKPGAVIHAWAPPGVLALWGQCRGGSAFHTWPDAEIVEVVDPVSGLPTPPGIAGHLIWTGTGWYASAVVRLDTHAAVVVRADACPTCGRRALRVEPMEVATGFPEVLDANSHVKMWSAELQRNDAGDELVIWIAPEGQAGMLELVADLNLKIGPVQVRLVDEDEIRRRLEETNGERFGDRRSFQP